MDSGYKQSRAVRRKNKNKEMGILHSNFINYSTQTLESHPSGKILFYTIKGFSEIIVGETVVRSPYEGYLFEAGVQKTDWVIY